MTSNKIVTRYAGNPILTGKDVPYDSTLVFNCGVTKYNGKYVMLFRNDYGDEEKKELYGTNIGLAFSDDGIHWEVQPKPCFDMKQDGIRRAYDPRLTVIDGVVYMCFATDGKHGVRGGIAKTEDFEHFDILSLSVPDNRNMVLFPEKINDKYVRLERPFPVYGKWGGEKFDIWLSKSPDLRYWGDSACVLMMEEVPFANAKIGPSAPPVKTEKGWLTTFHSVDIDNNRHQDCWEDNWHKRYSTGIMLLDLEEPTKIVGMSKKPLLVPEASYERFGGFRGDAIFTTGMILEDDGEVKIYYGAADANVSLATANVDDLVKACLE